MESEVIDLTPTWEQIVPALILLIESGGNGGKKTAKEELLRMARLADSFTKLNKEGCSLTTK